MMKMPATFAEWAKTVRGFTLDDLSKAWNELRNAVAGRGLARPSHVSPQLYDRVTKEHAAFRAWLDNAGPMQQLMVELSQGQFFGFLDIYRDTAWLAKQEGVLFNVLPQALPLPQSPAELQAQLDAEGRPVTLDDLSNLNAPKDWKPKPWQWGSYALYAGLGLAAVLILPPLLGSLTRRM